MTIKKNAYRISTEKSTLDLTIIHNYLSQEAYWSKGIPKNIIEKAIENSLCFGLFHLDDQIGFARVVTDKTTFAYLADVFVLPDFRARGLSKWMMETIMNHSDLQGLRRWVLLTGDAHGLYKQYGWNAIASPERWMEINCPASDLYGHQE